MKNQVSSYIAVAWPFPKETTYVFKSIGEIFRYYLHTTPIRNNSKSVENLIFSKNRFILFSRGNFKHSPLYPLKTTLKFSIARSIEWSILKSFKIQSIRTRKIDTGPWLSKLEQNYLKFESCCEGVVEGEILTDNIHRSSPPENKLTRSYWKSRSQCCRNYFRRDALKWMPCIYVPMYKHSMQTVEYDSCITSTTPTSVGFVENVASSIKTKAHFNFSEETSLLTIYLLYDIRDYGVPVQLF